MAAACLPACLPGLSIDGVTGFTEWAALSFQAPHRRPPFPCLFRIRRRSYARRCRDLNTQRARRGPGRRRGAPSGSSLRRLRCPVTTAEPGYDWRTGQHGPSLRHAVWPWTAWPAGAWAMITDSTGAAASFRKSVLACVTRGSCIVTHCLCSGCIGPL